MTHRIRAALSDLLHRWSHRVDPHKLRVDTSTADVEMAAAWIASPPKCGKCGRTLTPR